MTQEHLKQARERAEAWERHHVPSVPRPHLTADLTRSLEHRAAGAITDFAGSMKFVYVHTAWFGVWVIINGGLLLGLGLAGLTPFDPFPFGLLTLIVSLEAIFLSTFVMIAQNRMADVADARAQRDYEVDVRAEAEIAKILHLVESLLEHHILTAQDVADAQGPTEGPAPQTETAG